MEGVLKELTVRALALTDLLDLDQYHWLSRRVAQRVVGPPGAQRVLRGDHLGVVDGPSKNIEQALNYALGDCCLVHVAPSFDAGPDV
jgi:hypothetical protein